MVQITRTAVRNLLGAFVVATLADGEEVAGKLTNYSTKSVWLTIYTNDCLDTERFIRAEKLERIVLCPGCKGVGAVDSNESAAQRSGVEVPLASGPSHIGSEYCGSGSIASGGSRSHCSCDRCY